MRFDPLKPIANQAPVPPPVAPAPAPAPVQPPAPPTPRQRLARATKARAKSRFAKRQVDPQAALMRAISQDSTANYETIFNGFAAMGIPMDQVKPRENVFTFHGWRALGRTVKRGEHGIKILARIPGETDPEATGDDAAAKKPKPRFAGGTVFHISQTEPLAQKPAAPPAQQATAHTQPAAAPAPAAPASAPAPTATAPTSTESKIPAWLLERRKRAQK